jgi:hypothetical protein
MADEFQVAEQQILNEAVTTDETISALDPTQPEPNHDAINKLAGDLWIAAGGVADSPLTLNYWLEAETLIKEGEPNQIAE